MIKALNPLNAVAVENPALPGTPDVNYIEGWIELKWLRSWPKRKDTIVRIPHFTAQQRIWHFRRRRLGGQSWFLLQVRKEWLLIDGAVAALTVNKCNRLDLICQTAVYWSDGLGESDLTDVLAARRQVPYQFTDGDIMRLRGSDD